MTCYERTAKLLGVSTLLSILCAKRAEVGLRHPSAMLAIFSSPFSPPPLFCESLGLMSREVGGEGQSGQREMKLALLWGEKGPNLVASLLVM